MQDTAELLQEENIKIASVPETNVGPCQLSMMDFFAKIVKDFQPFTISAKIFPPHRMFDRVLNKNLYTLSNYFILENCFILSFSIMICPFHMRTRSRNICILDRSLWRKALALAHSGKCQLQLFCGFTVLSTELDNCRTESFFILSKIVYSGKIICWKDAS